MEIAISKHRCPRNHICPAVSVCPVDAITQDGYGLPIVDMEKCVKCKRCISFCPMGAIEAV